MSQKQVLPPVKREAGGLDIESAKQELNAKTDEQVQRETAFKWASRAIAAYQLALEKKTFEAVLRAEDYRHEALEHAALVGDDGKILSYLCRNIDQFRDQLPEQFLKEADLEQDPSSSQTPAPSFSPSATSSSARKGPVKGTPTYYKWLQSRKQGKTSQAPAPAQPAAAQPAPAAPTPTLTSKESFKNNDPVQWTDEKGNKKAGRIVGVGNKPGEYIIRGGWNREYTMSADKLNRVPGAGGWGGVRHSEVDPNSLSYRSKLSRAAQDKLRSKEIESHFQGEKHRSGGCGPVCTYGEWDANQGTGVPEASVPDVGGTGGTSMGSTGSTGGGKKGPVKGTPAYDKWIASFRASHPQSPIPPGASPTSGSASPTPKASGSQSKAQNPAGGETARQPQPSAESLPKGPSSSDVSINRNIQDVKTRANDWLEREAKARGMGNDDKFKLQYATHVHDKINSLNKVIRQQLQALPDMAAKSAFMDNLASQPAFKQQKELSDKFKDIYDAYPNIISQMPAPTDPQRKEKEDAIMQGFKGMPGEESYRFDFRKALGYNRIAKSLDRIEKSYINWVHTHESGQTEN